MESAVKRRPGGRTAVKRQALLDGARAVFAHQGYLRAGIDEIAAAAGVSNRTVYSHFADKAALFEAVITESAAAFAEQRVALIRRHLVVPRPDLRVFASEWVQVDPLFEAHFALVRRVLAEAPWIPEDILRAWSRSGPIRVRAALGAAFAELIAAGVLRRTPPGVLARHFIQLVDGPVNDLSLRGARSLRPGQVERIARDGVDAFIAAYATPPAADRA